MKREASIRTMLKGVKQFSALALPMGLSMALLPAAAHAVNAVSLVTDQCSGTRQTTTTSSYHLACAEHFTLADGVITSDLPLVITGESTLSLMNVKIVAPTVTLRSNGALTLGSGVELITGSASIEAASGSTTPGISIASGATITAGGGAPAVQLTQSANMLVASGNNTVPTSVTTGNTTVAASEQKSGGGGALGLIELLAMLGAAAGCAIRSPQGCRRSA